jgi:hypothetical protein
LTNTYLTHKTCSSAHNPTFFLKYNAAGSADLPKPKKTLREFFAQTTPPGKGAPQAPANTPATPADGAREGRPPSASGADALCSGRAPDQGGKSAKSASARKLKGQAAGAAADSAPARLDGAGASSPQGSLGSVVSIGSHCTPAAPGAVAFGSPQLSSLSRALDFTRAASGGGPAASPVEAETSGSRPETPAFGEEDLGRPAALDDLFASLQDSATKQAARGIFAATPDGAAAAGGARQAQAEIEAAGEAPAMGAAATAAALARAAGAAAPAPRRGRTAGAAVGALLVALLANAALRPGAFVPPPTPYSSSACTGALQGYLGSAADKQAPAWRGAAMQAASAACGWVDFATSKVGQATRSAGGPGADPAASAAPPAAPRPTAEPQLAAVPASTTTFERTKMELAEFMRPVVSALSAAPTVDKAAALNKAAAAVEVREAKGASWAAPWLAAPQVEAVMKVAAGWGQALERSWPAARTFAATHMSFEAAVAAAGAALVAVVVGVLLLIARLAGGRGAAGQAAALATEERVFTPSFKAPKPRTRVAAAGVDSDGAADDHEPISDLPPPSTARATAAARRSAAAARRRSAPVNPAFTDAGESGAASDAAGVRGGRRASSRRASMAGGGGDGAEAAPQAGPGRAGGRRGAAAEAVAPTPTRRSSRVRS